MNQAEWKALLAAVEEVQKWFPYGVAFIGGIAVFAHVMDRPDTAKYAGMSHDADFMIRSTDFADLRDIEVLTPNRRLSKQQFSKDGFEFDVYVEGQHNLPVPADEAVAWSVLKQGFRVVCAEHLLILKLKAYENRRGTGKGEKDEEDVIRILLAAKEWRRDGLTRMTDEMLEHLKRIVAGDAPTRLTSRNLHEARNVRDRARESLKLICDAHTANFGAENANSHS
jgi:hypothetical protein